MKRHRPAFSLIDLAVTLAVVVIACLLLLPTLRQGREEAREGNCQEHLRQLGQAAQSYAQDHAGKFFYHWWQFRTKPDGQPGFVAGWWYDTARIGPYLPDVERVKLNVFHWDVKKPGEQIASAAASANPVYQHYRELEELINKVMVCPTHDGEVKRSYAMNFWASSVSSTPYVKESTSHAVFSKTHGAGEFFDTNTPNQDKLLLFTEGHVDPMTMRVRQENTFGIVSPPSYRFGGHRNGNGDLIRVTKTMPPSWLLDYARHASAPDPNRPWGQVNIAFADGHVALTPTDRVYSAGERRSTYNVLWSPIDKRVDQEYISNDPTLRLGGIP